MMYFILFTVLFVSVAANEDEEEKGVCINDIANTLVSVLDSNAANNARLNELKEKLKKIENYVIDQGQFGEILINESKDDSLNETNFYKALDDQNNFPFVLGGEPKNLYSKLKDKMNRDDIMKLLADRNQTNQVVKAARRMGGDDAIGGANDEEVIDEVVDKFLGEVSTDNHKYSQEKLSNNIYWDPQKELEDLKEYHGHSGRRIFKGERTTIRYYPFMASVHVMGRFWCGGTLYWHDLVLTSAACLQLMHNNRFFRENPRVLQVRVGSNHSRLSGELIDALEVFFHPGYNPRTLRNNIAVIRLRHHLYFDYHRVPKIIPIAHGKNALPPTAEVMLLGWGVTKMSQRLAYEPIFLQRKFLPVYPNYFCKEVYGDKFITSTMFCAGTMTTGEGACDHDAGGPAVLAGKLVGIISFGPSVCGYPNAPTVFTLVGAFADWIEQVNETIPEYYRGQARTTTTTPFTPTKTTMVLPDDLPTSSPIQPVDFRSNQEMKLKFRVSENKPNENGWRIKVTAD